MNTKAAAIVALLVALCPASTAFAQGSTEEASTHFRRGATLYEEQDYRGALAEFRRAYEIAPSAAVLFNIGQAHYQLQEYARALEHLERYLAETGSGVAAARRQLVEKELAELRGRVAEVQIETNVAGAEIVVDDEVVATSPATVRVGTGRRTITARAPGYVPVTKKIDFASGRAPALTFELAAAGAGGSAGDVSAPAPSPSPLPEERRTHPLVYAGFGVGAAGVAVGSVFGLMALSARSELDSECPGKICPDTSHVRGEHDALERNATISTIGFAAGAVGLLAGTYFLLVPPRSSTTAAKTTAATPRVTPWFAGTSGGVSGSF